MVGRMMRAHWLPGGIQSFITFFRIFWVWETQLLFKTFFRYVFQAFSKLIRVLVIPLQVNVCLINVGRLRPFLE